MTARSDIPHSGWPRVLAIAAIVGIAVAGAWTLGDALSFDTLRDNRDALLAYRDTHLGAMAAGFVLIYVLIVAFSLPGASVASVTGGFLFGLGLGTALNIVAATIGAAGLFLAVRWGFGAALTRRIEASDGRVREIQKGLHDNAISVMFMMRLVPIVPFFVANLLPALVGVPFRSFLMTTALGILPGALVITWIGVGLGEVFERGEDPDLSLIWEPYILGPLLGLALLAALPMVLRAWRARKAK